MANCTICGKKMGFMDGTTLENKIRGTSMSMGGTINVCDNCLNTMNRLKQGNLEAYLTIHKMIGYDQYSSVNLFVRNWEKIPDEITGNPEYADKSTEEIIKSYEEKKQQEDRVANIAAQKRNAALPGILISSGFSFEGYRIVKYSGYISGDDAIQINRGDLFVNAGQNLTDALVLIRAQALKELKEAAYDLGCNAVIGVDFDYLTFEPETANSSGGTTYQPYVVCVTANGNAVVIEKEN